MRNITVGLDVNYVAAPEKEGGKPTIKKGKIHEIFSSRAARIAIGENSHVQAEYSAGGEIGTFHFLDEAKDVKQQPTAFTPGEPANGTVNK